MRKGSGAGRTLRAISSPVLTVIASGPWIVVFLMATLLGAVILTFVPQGLSAAEYQDAYGNLGSVIVRLGCHEIWGSFAFSGILMGLALPLLIHSVRMIRVFCVTKTLLDFRDEMDGFGDAAWQKTVRYGNTSVAWASGGLLKDLQGRGWQASRLDGDNGQILLAAQYGRWSFLGVGVVYLGLTLILLSVALTPWLRDEQCIGVTPFQTIALDRSEYPFDVAVDEITSTEANRGFVARVRLVGDEGERGAFNIEAGKPVHQREAALFLLDGKWILNALHQDQEGSERLVYLWSDETSYLDEDKDTALVAVVSQERPSLVRYRVEGVDERSGVVAIGETIDLDGEKLTFTGQRPYVTLLLRSDPTIPFLTAGWLLVAGALFPAWGIRRRRIWAIIKDEGGVAEVRLAGDSPLDAESFPDEVVENRLENTREREEEGTLLGL